jgi:hypothetical protein
VQGLARDVPRFGEVVDAPLQVQLKRKHWDPAAAAAAEAARCKAVMTKQLAAATAAMQQQQQQQQQRPAKKQKKAGAGHGKSMRQVRQRRGKCIGAPGVSWLLLMSMAMAGGWCVGLHHSVHSAAVFVHPGPPWHASPMPSPLPGALSR